MKKEFRGQLGRGGRITLLDGDAIEDRWFDKVYKVTIETMPETPLGQVVYEAAIPTGTWELLKKDAQVSWERAALAVIDVWEKRKRR